MGNTYSRISFGPQITIGIKQIIIFTSIIFVIQTILEINKIGFLKYYFSLSLIKIKEFNFYQFVSYGFLHADFFHILFNMLNLWMFGSEIERLWAKKDIFYLYFLSIVFGGVFFIFSNLLQFTNAYVIGASGGVFGVMTCYTFLWPNREFLFFGVIPIKAKYLLPLILFLGIVLDAGKTSHAAHFGGIFAGFLFFQLKTKFRFDFNFSISRYFQKRKMLRYQEEMYKKQHVKETVDELLEKISKKGMSSLTKKEKEFLKEASDKYYNE